MEVQEFIDKIKAKLGSNLPDDLTFEYENGELSFYNKNNHGAPSVLSFSEVEDFEFNIDACCAVIKHYHTPFFKDFHKKTTEESLKESERGTTIKHVGKELTETEIHENRSSKYEFLEFGKEETLEEAVVKRINDNVLLELHHSTCYSFAELGAKWQQEISYSEEDVLKFTQTIISQYKSGNTNIENIDLLTETLDKFKKSRKLSEKK